jgi:hypothetical protein
MTEYEMYLENYRESHRVNMWNDEVVRDMMQEFNISYKEAYEARKNWYYKFERDRLPF